MTRFFKEFSGAFWGKVVAALFVAVCAYLGFGPEKWAEIMIQDLPTWITPRVARIAFGSLAFVTFLFVFQPWKWLIQQQRGPNIKVEITGKWLDQKAHEDGKETQRVVKLMYDADVQPLLRYHVKLHILNLSRTDRASLNIAAYYAGNTVILGNINTGDIKLSLGPQEETNGTLTVDLDEFSARGEQSVLILDRLTGHKALVKVPGRYPPGLPLPRKGWMQTIKEAVTWQRKQ